MNRRHQAVALAALFALGLLLLAVLAALPPTIDGVALRSAELTVPMVHLHHEERRHLLVWLGLDYGFALVYSVFYTWGLRWLAAGTRRAWLNFLGRSLSWLTAAAFAFDAAENAILWASASTAAAKVSPWLSSLVTLKFLSSVIFLVYAALWLYCRWRIASKGPGASVGDAVPPIGDIQRPDLAPVDPGSNADHRTAQDLSDGRRPTPPAGNIQPTQA